MHRVALPKNGRTKGAYFDRGELSSAKAPQTIRIFFSDSTTVVFEESSGVAVAHLEGSFAGVVEHGQVVAAEAVARASPIVIHRVARESCSLGRG